MLQLLLILVPALAFEMFLAMRVSAGIAHRLLPAWILRAGSTPAYPRPPSLMEVGHTAGTAALLFVPFLLLKPTVYLLRTSGFAEPLAFERISVWAGLVGQCADVIRERDPELPEPQGLSLRVPCLRVRGARYMRGTVPLFSRRQKVAKAHADRVVATLRKAELRLDVDPDGAAKELGRLALTICDRYADKRIGQLLDDEDLAEAGPRHEVLRLCAALVALAAATLTVSALHLPPSVAMASAAIAVAVIYRSAVASGLSVLSMFLPILFTGK
ncbi:hypothetical protein [Streptomyces sp. NPDC002221]|uniref:hypothetical protein n=1 Tax=Streptomyces sp. NPDC002221 TaxID=3364639 RepID=UPI003684287A